MVLVATVTVWERAKTMWGLWAVYDTAVAAAIKENPMAAKNILASKVFWFNAIAGVIGFAQQQGLFAGIPDPYGPAVVILGNILLRFLTTQPVSLSAPLATTK